MLAVYGRDIAPRHAFPADTAIRMGALLRFFGDKRLSQINGNLCRTYAGQRSSKAAARRELEDLRAACNHYHREGLVTLPIKIVLPERSIARERYLERSEAARLLLHAWRYRERQNTIATDRLTRRHVARFILVGLYAGRRSSAIMAAALEPVPGRGTIDLVRGVFHPPAGLRRTKKRQPPIQLPRRLLAHMRRWKRRGQRYVVEWNGEPIKRIGKAFRATARAVGLDDVTPHTLRHTSATWLMQRSADPWAASGYLGMSVETLIRVYGHHHPDHLKAAWGVFDRPGGIPKPKPFKPVRRKARRALRGAPKRKARRVVRRA